MLKRNLLAVVIPALLAAGAVNAAEVYNKDGNKLDLYGKVDGRHLFSSDKRKDRDDSYARFGFKGETQVSDQLTGFGQWEYEARADKAESQGTEGNKTSLGFAGLKFADYGSIDYGRNYGVIYDVNAWTDVLPVFGGDTIADSDNFMTQRATGLATYRNNNFFGLVDGLNFALQYQGKNNEKTDSTRDLKSQNGDGFGLSSTYDVGYGVSVGAAYSSSSRTEAQKTSSLAEGKKAQAWNVGAKYDANNVYLAAMYAETLNMTGFGSEDIAIAPKTQDIELVAMYQFDFGLQPSLAYVQSKGKTLPSGEEVNNGDLLKYVAIGSYYHFNKNITAYVDYKINLLKNDDFNKAAEISNKNVVGVGMVYQF